MTTDRFYICGACGASVSFGDARYCDQISERLCIDCYWRPAKSISFLPDHGRLNTRTIGKDGVTALQVHAGDGFLEYQYNYTDARGVERQGCGSFCGRQYIVDGVNYA